MSATPGGNVEIAVDVAGRDTIVIDVVNEPALVHGAKVVFGLLIPAREMGDNFGGPAVLRGVGALDGFG